jgi:6-phosphofructokinase 1
MDRIAVLTSGGDGPGLNPAIRAVTRAAIKKGAKVFGVRWGYKGLIRNDMSVLTSRDVGGVLNRGGTFLGTARAPEFKDLKVRRTAIRHMHQNGVEGLVVIGGNGSLAGALALHEMGFPTVGIPASIDNDVSGTDMAVGVDTALNTILDSIDRIKDTASSHQRAFLIEVMGRDSGYLALQSGLAGGAEIILVPEREGPALEDIGKEVVDAYVRGKGYCIIIVAEGWDPGTRAIAEYLRERKDELGFDVRVTVLGHVQRGGRPSVFDRTLATRMGSLASDALLSGESGVMTALQGGELNLFPLEEAVAELKPLDTMLLELAEMMD